LYNSKESTSPKLSRPASTAGATPKRFRSKLSGAVAAAANQSMSGTGVAREGQSAQGLPGGFGDLEALRPVVEELDEVNRGDCGGVRRVH
jgi:hypothetical protein